MSATLTQIPIVDFEPFIHGNQAEQRAVVQQVYQACHEIGFMYLTDCGLSAPTLAEMFAQSQQFFALPDALKQQIAWSNPVSNRGYGGLGREQLEPDRPGDFKETLNIGREVPPAGRQEEPNHWLSEPPEFRQVALAFFASCAQVSDQVLRSMALALDLPQEFFVTRHTEQHHILRLLHYPSIDQDLPLGQIRAGAHSDYGSLTLLFQDAIGGLEVKTVAGNWIAAPPIPNTVLVNLGDLMERWTNHVFRSTVHRVLLPDSAQARIPRYSIAFFCHPNEDVEIACLDSCQSADRPPLYPPVLAGDYVIGRLQETY
jgi:isopenicillin N synthase-like dioxygenase